MGYSQLNESLGSERTRATRTYQLRVGEVLEAERNGRFLELERVAFRLVQVYGFKMRLHGGLSDSPAGQQRTQLSGSPFGALPLALNSRTLR